MPEAVVAIATAVSAAAADTVGLFTVSSAAIEATSAIAYSAAAIGVTTGALFGLASVLQPKLPDGQALQIPLKQAMPPRVSGFGRVRLGGAYAFFGTGVGTAKALSIDILAMLDGRSQGIVARYLHDDLMAPVGDYWYAPGAPGKYGGGGSNPPNLVQFDHRLGLPTETSYSEITPALPLWDASHRGDGVTSLALYCKPARREDQSGDFPNGVPVPSAVFDTQLIFDPRDGSQTQGDPSTYKYNDNAPLTVIAYTTDAAGGMGLDYDRFWAPAMDITSAALDEADGLVSTSGMHATLLDAAAAGDTTIFLADTTGLAAGVDIDITGTETVTVSSIGLAGEVDLTGALTLDHGAGELAYWNATGQATRYRCAMVYRHDTPPGDVIKAALSSFDGWMMQRGDGALVLRTNALYTPTVVLTDRHIVGYQVQHYLPDEQATNQLIVSYTDPASAFNQAEAGYVQDDLDIAARGLVRTQPLYLQSVPSGPQAIAVARAVLARSTQPLRGTLTCNLAGLAVMGERYIGVQIAELPELNNAIIEVVGKPKIDLPSKTVSFPWVAAGNFGLLGNSAVCFALDVSMGSHPEIVTKFQAAVTEALSMIAGVNSGAVTVDLCAVAWGYDGNVTSAITKRSASAADVDDIKSFVAALTSNNQSTDPRDGLNAAKTFFDATDPSVGHRALFMLTDGDIKVVPAATVAAGAAAIAASMTGVDIYAMRLPQPTSVTPNELTYMAMYDNTAADGVPTFSDAAGVARAIEGALFGSSSTPGSGYTLPSLAPPSGAALQPLTAPTIITVTADYPSSGGGVSGARLLIQVDDPGLGNQTWKVQWKLSTDSLWTQIPGPLDADGSPLTLQTGLIAAAGSIDVQVAYAVGSQVSPWSSTSTVSVTPPPTSTTTLTASAALTAGQIVNIWASTAAKVRPADVSDDAHSADGFVLSGFASGATATVYLPGQIITGLSLLTPGAVYFLAASGGITAVVPSSGWLQVVGKALSATTLLFQPEPGELRA